MERSLLLELKKVNLIAYVNRQRDALLRRMYWQQFFPLKQTLTLDWESLTGSSGVPVMADVVEYNASAPIKTRRTVTSQSGDIPKTTIKRRMDEKDLNEYGIYKALARGDADKNAILDIVFDDVDFVNAGVMGRTEYLGMQALSYGSLALTSSNNNGIITETAVDFGIPSAQKIATDTTWTTAATATPIADFRTVKAAAKLTGRTVNWAIMGETEYAYLVATTEVKDAYAYFQGVTTGRIAIPGLDGINAMLRAERLPQIFVVDSQVRHEDGDHALSVLDSWKAGYVTFIPDFNVGKTLHGPIAEENSAEVKKIATTAKVGHIWIIKWSELEPFAEFTKGQANMFPSFGDTASIWIMKTDATSWS